MADIPAILRDLPLEHIIGAPMQAAIKAQALAAKTTVDFIKEVGLKSVPVADLQQSNLPAGAVADPPKGDDAPEGDQAHLGRGRPADQQRPPLLQRRLAG